MTDARTLLQQALDALQVDSHIMEDYAGLITTIRSHLAAEPVGVVEPVAIAKLIFHDEYDGHIQWLSNPVEDGTLFYAATSPPAAEPVEAVPVANPCGAPAVGGPCVLPAGHNMGRADIPANHQAAPPAAVPPVPLTDEQIMAMWHDHRVPAFGMHGINPIVFARAVERAHGIGASDEI